MTDGNYPIINVHPFSLTTTRLSLFRDEIELAIGSGFLWRFRERLCVVTAWHNLTGTHPTTRQSLSKTGARPNRVVATLLSPSIEKVFSYSYDLYDADGNPTWVVHPLGSQEIDIAVFPVNNLDDAIGSKPANEIEEARMSLGAGSDLFILGYPRNLDRLGLPIWKRASLAMDPDAILDEPNHRHYLVDSATREGLSGGLVISMGYGMYPLPGGGMSMGNGATKIVGIYSGRISSEDEMSAQIGIVWPIKYVYQLLDNAILDKFVG